MADRLPRFPDEPLVYFDEWLTVADAAKVLGVTDGRVRQMIKDRNFKEIAAIGDRPLYLLRANEVAAMVDILDRREQEIASRRKQRRAATDSK